MSDLVSLAAIKDLLAECPICIEHFDDSTRIPRRMPCCEQSICQPCLETYSGVRTAIRCPVCRQQLDLSNGVTTLPKDTVILKTLAHLKIKKGVYIPCTDCPDKETALAHCEKCGTFLCSLCLNAHKRNTLSKYHIIYTFDQMKGRPERSVSRLKQCRQHQQPLRFYCRTCDKVACVSCTVIEHKEERGHNVVSVDEERETRTKSKQDVLLKMEEKTKRLTATEADLQQKIENITMSKRIARDDINKTFDNLVDYLQQRRRKVLSNIDEESAKNLNLAEEALNSTRFLLTKLKYMRNKRTKVDTIDDLQVQGSAEASIHSILKESPHEIPFDRTGVSFVQANVKQLRDMIKVTGMIRTVTFTPTERPDCVPASETYNAIILEPAEIPTVTAIDRMMSDKEITSPTLEWDSSTADNCLDVSECVITNTAPTTPSTNTGCRMLNSGLCLSSRPLVVRRGQRCKFRVKFSFSMKKLVGNNKLIQEIALTPFPVEASRSQLTGLSVNVGTCSNHKEHLCLRVDYNRDFLTDIPITPIRVGQSCDLQLDFLLDGVDDTILVTDADDHCVYTTVTDVEFDRPIWVMTCLGLPTTADVRGELITGHDVTKPSPCNICPVAITD